MDGAAGQHAEVLARARWGAAEDRIYPMAMSDPGSFRQGLEAVRALVDELRRTAGTFDDLLAVEAEPSPLLAALPGGGLPVPVDLVVQAACGVRGRELAAARDGERRSAAVAAARAAGRPWAVLGGPERIEELAAGTSVAAHLPSGRTLVAAVDPYSGADRYRLQEFGSAGEPRRDETFADTSSWMAARHRWRAEIESS